MSIKKKKKKTSAGGEISSTVHDPQCRDDERSVVVRTSDLSDPAKLHGKERSLHLHPKNQLSILNVILSGALDGTWRTLHLDGTRLVQTAAPHRTGQGR